MSEREGREEGADYEMVWERFGGGMRTYIWNIARKTREQDITGSDFSRMEVFFFYSNRGIRQACKKERKKKDMM